MKAGIRAAAGVTAEREIESKVCRLAETAQSLERNRKTILSVIFTTFICHCVGHFVRHRSSGQMGTKQSMLYLLRVGGQIFLNRSSPLAGTTVYDSANQVLECCRKLKCL